MPKPPSRGRALSFAALWLVVAIVAVGVSIWVLSSQTFSVALRITIALFLAVLSTAALMLGSDSLAEGLRGRASGAGRILQWFGTSVVALAVAVVIGAPVTSFAPDSPTTSSLLLDLALDVCLGAVAGAVATGLIVGAAGLLGPAISWAERQLHVDEKRARRWDRPAKGKRHLGRQFVRGAALGSAGLLLSALCTAVVTTATRNPTGGADAPVPRAANFVLNAALPVLCWFIGTSLVWAWFGRRHADDLEPQHPVRHGTHGVALAICLMIAALWITAAELESKARGRLWSGPRHPVPAVPVNDQEFSSGSPYLAERFEPQLWLRRNEPWSPTEVGWYVRQDPQLDTDPPFCNHGPVDPPPGCRQILSTGHPPQQCDTAHPGSCANSGAADPALYYRYFDPSETTPKDRPRAGAGDGWKLIQYWMFYNYDSLDTWAISQWHQSDWEQVSVLVRRTGPSVSPVEVAFSEHCYGARLPAERVRWTDGSHPRVYVGLGSHANYPRPVSVPVRQLRCSLGVTPRYLGVAGLFLSPAIDGSRLEIPVAYLAGLRDQTSHIQPLPMLKLVPLAQTPEVLSFDGYWGLDNNLSPWGTVRLRSSAGPAAPQTQGAWATPFPSMLCNGRWLSTPPSKRSETAWVCP